MCKFHLCPVIWQVYSARYFFVSCLRILAQLFFCLWIINKISAISLHVPFVFSLLWNATIHAAWTFYFRSFLLHKTSSLLTIFYSKFRKEFNPEIDSFLLEIFSWRFNRSWNVFSYRRERAHEDCSNDSVRTMKILCTKQYDDRYCPSPPVRALLPEFSWRSSSEKKLSPMFVINRSEKFKSVPSLFRDCSFHYSAKNINLLIKNRRECEFYIPPQFGFSHEWRQQLFHSYWRIHLYLRDQQFESMRRR